MAPRIASEAARAAKPPIASHSARRESGLGDAAMSGPAAAARVWLVTNEPVTTPA
jgi:hypothetical protein